MNHIIHHRERSDALPWIILVVLIVLIILGYLYYGDPFTRTAGTYRVTEERVITPEPETRVIRSSNQTGYAGSTYTTQSTETTSYETVINP